MRSLALVSAVFLVACTPTSTPAPAPRPAPAPLAPAAVAAAIDAAAPAPVAVAVAGVDSGAASADPFAALAPSLPIPTGSIAKVKRSGTEWPFHKWDRAEAAVLNWADYGPQTSMHVVDDRGWSPHVKYRAPLDAQHAKMAVGLVAKQHGELLVSKCPAPRHAVVLYDGDDPVASINVCFTCHDILLWPQWPAKPTQADYDRMQKLEATFLPAWQGVFIDDLKFPLWSGH